MTDTDAVIDTLIALKEAKPAYEYTLEDLKADIDQGSTQDEKNAILKSIVEEGGSAISQCDAFELFVYTDAWRSLRDLLEVDEWRTSFNFRGDNIVYETELQYPDPCFAKPFWQYEPKERVDSEWENLFLFVEGVLRPRSKQLKYHLGQTDVIPTRDEDGDYDKKEDLIDDSVETSYQF